MRKKSWTLDDDEEGPRETIPLSLVSCLPPKNLQLKTNSHTNTLTLTYPLTDTNTHTRTPLFFSSKRKKAATFSNFLTYSPSYYQLLLALTFESCHVKKREGERERGKVYFLSFISKLKRSFWPRHALASACSSFYLQACPSALAAFGVAGVALKLQSSTKKSSTFKQ